MLFRIRSMLTVLHRSGHIPTDQDIGQAENYMLTPDGQGLDSLLQEGLEVQVCTLRKNELLFMPLGWIRVEIAQPSVHLYGIRKSYFLASSLKDYQLSSDIVRAQEKNIKRMLQISDIMAGSGEVKADAGSPPPPCQPPDGEALL